MVKERKGFGSISIEHDPDYTVMPIPFFFLNRSDFQEGQFCEHMVKTFLITVCFHDPLYPSFDFVGIIRVSYSNIEILDSLGI